MTASPTVISKKAQASRNDNLISPAFKKPPKDRDLRITTQHSLSKTKKTIQIDFTDSSQLPSINYSSKTPQNAKRP